MKKRLILIIPICFLVLAGIIIAIHVKPAIHTMPATTDSLTQSQIDQLREQYPINDAEPATVDMISPSLEDCIRTCDCFVEVEVIGEPTGFVKTITIDYDTPEGALHEKAGGLTEFDFVKCEVRILNDAFDSINQDTIEVTYNSMFSVGMPIMDVGSKFIMGGVYNEKTGTIDIGSDTMFYVTDDDYILSVKSETSKSRHTGIKVDAFFEYLRTVKKETGVIETTKDRYWVDYVQFARSELLNSPEKYPYPEDVDTLLESAGTPKGIKLLEVNEQEVLEARAQIYAKCKVYGYICELEDVVVCGGKAGDSNEEQVFTWIKTGDEWSFCPQFSYCENNFIDITDSVEYYEAHYGEQNIENAFWNSAHNEEVSYEKYFEEVQFYSKEEMFASDYVNGYTVACINDILAVYDRENGARHVVAQLDNFVVKVCDEQWIYGIYNQTELIRIDYEGQTIIVLHKDESGKIADYMERFYVADDTLFFVSGYEEGWAIYRLYLPEMKMDRLQSMDYEPTMYAPVSNHEITWSKRNPEFDELFEQVSANPPEGKEGIYNNEDIAVARGAVELDYDILPNVRYYYNSLTGELKEQQYGLYSGTNDDTKWWEPKLFSFDETKEYEVNVYEFPLICLDMEGRYIEIKDISWHIWLLEEEGGEKLSLDYMPRTTEELHEILKRCVAEVIRVPKDLSPIFGLTLPCMGGQGYTLYGQDEAYFYYSKTFPDSIRLAAPTEEHAGNTELVREKLPAKVYVKESEKYVQSVYEHVKAEKNGGKGFEQGPYWMYSTYVYSDMYPDYRETLRDSFWVEQVQWARKELLNNPEKYDVSEERIKALLEEDPPRNEAVIWKAEASEVIDARAQRYASAKCRGSKAGLEDIIVLYGYYEGKAEYEPLIWAYDFAEKTWWQASHNYYVDIMPSLEYYREHFVEVHK